MSPYHQWLLVFLAAFTVGITKAGISIGVISILLLAEAFEIRESNGVLLLFLILGDLIAITFFHRHTSWQQLKRVLLPCILGLAAGFVFMKHVSISLRPIVGVITLSMAVMQIVRPWLNQWVHDTFHSRIVAWSMGGLGGFFQMIANASGPMMSLFFLMIGLSKYEMIGTGAYFYLTTNLVKVPLMYSLELLPGRNLVFVCYAVPVLLFGFFVGTQIVKRLSQLAFERVVLVLAIVGSIRLMLT